MRTGTELTPRAVVSGPPAWARQLVGAAADEAATPESDLRIRLARGARFSLTSVTLAGARRLGATELAERTERAYDLLAERLQDAASPHAVRIWNMIPGILEPLGDLPHRYMSFNAGRYRSVAGRLGESLSRLVATASGVGSPGDELAIHCLASARPGEALENPRQVPSYRYSDRYGPLPPCFSRAVRLSPAAGAAAWLLVGGTASIHGEDVAHPGDLQRQSEETLRNLGCLVAVARGERWSGGEAGGPPPAALDAYRCLRVYHVHPAQRPAIERLIASRFRYLRELEYVETDLCRPELLIEIEGVAEVAPAGASAAG